ncbi:phospholipid scramblase 3-like isoform X2 [Dendrobates tinctorius]|uniref:phospholipid scramblase 3-like isoform X2 n=1 Tax=Dendrobates tinctorius TaxID=92724 RepID=UPI003CC977B7
MDPHPAGQPRNNHYALVQTQPQWQNARSLQVYNPRAVVPPGLTCLVEVEEVTLHKKAFFTRSKQTLFTIRRESECCGPAFNLILQDPKKRDVVSLCTNSGEGCCGGDTHLNIMVLPSHMIGFVQIVNSSRKMRVSIQMKFGEPAFTAELPLSGSENTIEILSVNGSCPVAKIIKQGKRESSKVIFQFPMDMEATLKTIILSAFLYMRYQLNKASDSSSSDYDSGWNDAGGVLFFSDDHGGFSDHGGGGGDWGGGGGDWGGGGGDCGGGGGDCGGGGGDCGGGGGDCGGGGGD